MTTPNETPLETPLETPNDNSESKGWYTHKKEKYQAWAKKIVDLTSDKDDARYGTGWDKLGFQRPVGKYFYTFGLLIPQVIMGMMLLPLLKYTELRFPEMASFEAAAGAIFGALYAILDLELGAVVDRFVPQYAVSNPRKAMQYVTFFIKYQMWSGLVQILFVAVFMFMYIIPYTDFAYLTWFILFINIKQYPAILSTFQSVIASLQHGDKENLIVFFRASVLEPITRQVGGLIGLYWGMANPVFGEMYGMALGFALGGYVDDFLTFTLGMYWLSKIIDRYNIRIWEMYGQAVPSDVWKSALSYSFRVLPKTIFGSFVGFFNFLLQYEGLPGYVTYTGLINMSNSLKKFTGWSEQILSSSQPSYSESFNNGKTTLTKYYVGEGLKYNYLFYMILGSFNLFALPVILEIALKAGFLTESWEMVGVIVPIQILLTTLHTPYNSVAERMINISGHPEVNTVWGICSTMVDLFFSWYFLFVLKLGWLGLIMAGLPMAYLGTVVKWVYMKKHVLNLDKAWWKDIAWQCFVSPLAAGAIFILYMEFLLQILWPIISVPFSNELVLVPAAIILVLLLFGMFFLYMPLVAFFGFFDERSLLTFKRAVALSGPSLWLIWPLYKILAKFHEKSPFKARATIKMGDEAMKELEELAKLRYEKFVAYLKK